MKTLLREIILRFKVTVNQVKTKKLCFWYFCRFVTSALTLGSPFLEHCSVFSVFMPLRIGLESQEPVHSLPKKFEYTDPDFWRLFVLVCFCAANQYSENNGIFFFFLRFETEEHVLRDNESEATVKNTFNGDHFETEASDD